MVPKCTADLSESEEVKINEQDSLVKSDALQPEQRNQKLADLGYYDHGFRDPNNQQSQTMEILLSGDESRVRSEYAGRKLRGLTRKPDGSNYYDNTIVHLMAQVLHSHERLAEARRQIDFLEDFVANQDLNTSYQVKTSAEEIIKETDEVLTKAKKWQIKNTYKPRFEILVQHIEISKEKLGALIDQLRGSKKRKHDEIEDTVMSDSHYE